MMRSPLASCLGGAFVVLSAAVATAGVGANYDFDIEYHGEGVTSLAPGSDEPTGLILELGDSFQWTISATNDQYWLVESAGGFFPLMGFESTPAAERTGEFALQLLNNGVEVFSLTDPSAVTLEVHLGTNTVNLPTGLAFDTMYLEYQLTDITPIAPNTSFSSTLGGRLPIFGAPEENVFSPGIIFVPEPSAGWLALLGCALVRRRVR